MTFEEKLQRLSLLHESDSLQDLKQRGLACAGNIANLKVDLVFGQKYVKLNAGGSGRLMIEIATGNIYGIKGYGQIHKGHAYGNLDTIDDWYWGRYYPEKKH